MRAKVYLLRRAGRRFHDRDQEGVEGELRIQSVVRGAEMHRVVQLCRRQQGAASEVELLPPLYAPELIALGGSSILLRGFESSGGIGYVQEWRCVLG